MTYGEMQIGGAYVGFEEGKNTEFLFPIRASSEGVIFIAYHTVPMDWSVVGRPGEREFRLIPFTNHNARSAVRRLFKSGIFGWSQYIFGWSK